MGGADYRHASGSQDSKKKFQVVEQLIRIDMTGKFRLHDCKEEKP